MVTTPLLYFAVIEGKFEGGAMLTASHLPARMNGIKLCREQAVPLSMDQGLPELNKMVAEGMPAGAGKRGKCRTMLFLDRYVEEISRFVQQPGPLRIAVDAGNGSIGPELSRFFPGYPMWKIDSFYTKPDGSFPHHVANPLLPENTKDLQKRVLLDKADIGVAFDGDADRCGFIDERGRRIREDLVTAFVAEFYLSQKPGERIVYDLRSSRIVPETISRFGGVPVRNRVGHSFMKEKMRQVDAVFAGELSGHYYYRDTGFTDNALFTMVQMLNFLTRKGKPLSEIMAPLDKYCATGEINMESRKSAEIYRALETTYRDARLDHLDGLTVTSDEWWFNLRASNTEPVMRLNLEADTSQLMAEKRNEVLGVIRATDAALKLKEG
jgi:phosphomannomutase